jgi:hypothetical protein
VLKKAILVAAVVLIAVFFAVNQMEEDRAPPAQPPDRAEGPTPVPPPLEGLPHGQLAEAGAEATREPTASSGETPPAPDGAWRVTVLGPEDVPIEGVRIHARGKQGAVETGPDGSVALPWEPVDGKLMLRTSGLVPQRYFQVVAPEKTIRFPKLTPLTAEVVDGESGAPIRKAALSLISASVPPIPLPRAGDGFATALSPLVPGERASLNLAVDLPDGYVLSRRKSWMVSGTVSRFAESVHVTVVAWPEAPVRLVVEEPDGSPAVGATVHMISSSLGLGLAYRAPPTGSGGETRITGLPCIPGESVVAFVMKDGRRATSTKGWIGRSGEEILLSAVLPAEAPPLGGFNSSIGIGGGAGGAFGGRGGRRGTLHSNPAGLVVLVVRRGGSPAKGALVVVSRDGKAEQSSRTDASGRARFTFHQSGDVTVAVQEAGFVMGRPVPARLTVGTTEQVTVIEARGTFLHVQVLTDEGLPAVSAELTVATPGRVPFTHLVDGVQRLNFFTDVDGRAVLPRLPSGRVRVTARLGSRKRTAEVGPGGFLELRLPRAR